MKRKLLGPSIILALAIAAAPAFAQAVNTVDGLRNALANPTAGGTITINGTIDASGGTMNGAAPDYNVQLPNVNNTMYEGGWPGARVYFGGATFDSGGNFVKGTQAVSGLTLQGTNNATLTRNPGELTGDYQFAYGALMSMNFYEDLTLQDLTLKGGKEIRKTNDPGTNVTTMADYGGAAVFNSNTGDLTFNRVNIADNWIEAVKQADTSAISVGAGGMRVIQSENVIFNGTKFTGNTAKLTDIPSNSAGGSQNFAAEAGGLYVSTFDSLNFTGTNDKDFSGNTVDATNASANGGALVVRIDKDTEEAAVNFKDVEFTDNMAKATISSTISDYTVARGGAASFRTDDLGTGNGPDLGVTLTNVNVHGNTAEVVQGTGGSLGSGGVTGAEGGGFNFSGYTTTVIENSQFDNNEAVSALGRAYGGAIYSSATANDTSKKALTVTDTDFTNNRVNGDTNAMGGAIYSAEDITISAVNKDVLFSGNTAQIGSVAATADSVYALKNAEYNAADGRTITDNDKITVGNTLIKDGAGNLIANEAVIQNALMINDGVAVFKTVSAPSTAINGDAILGVDGRSASLGGITFGDAKARLIVAGNCTDTSCIVGTLGNPGQKNQVINLASLTDWGVDVSGSLKNLGVRSQAFMNDNYLAASQVHQKYTGLHAVRDHLISGAVLSTVPQYEYGYFGQAMDLSPCGMVGHPAGHKQSRSAWANYIGRKSHYSSSFNNTDWDFSTSGVQVGTDIFRSCRNQFGIFFGYEGSNGWNAADKIGAKDYYVGLYGVHVFNNGMDLRAVFNYGWQDFNSRRYDLLQNTHRMAFDGNSAELNLELGKRRYFGNWSARPLIALDWNYSRLSRGQEDGIVSEAINYKSTDLSQLFFRFGTDLRYELGRWAVEGGVYYSYDLLGDDLQTGVSLADGSLPSSLAGSELGRSVLTYNIGGSWNVYRNLSIFGGYRGEVTPESIGNGVAHTGYVGAALRW